MLKIWMRPFWWRNDSHVGPWWLSSCYLLFKAGVKGGHTEYTLPILNQYSEDPASRVQSNLIFKGKMIYLFLVNQDNTQLST